MALSWFCNGVKIVVPSPCCILRSRACSPGICPYCRLQRYPNPWKNATWRAALAVLSACKCRLVQAVGNGSVRSREDVLGIVRSTLLAQHTPAAVLDAAASAAADALM